MPEGDTIFRTATVLRRALAGRIVTGFELVAPKVTQAAARRQIVGGTVKAVESNGKHLLITFTTDGEDVVLHTHMRMQGRGTSTDRVSARGHPHGRVRRAVRNAAGGRAHDRARDSSPSGDPRTRAGRDRRRVRYRR